MSNPQPLRHSSRTLRFRWALSAALFLSILLGAFARPTTSQADYLADIGLTALENELGVLTPTGSGIKISQIEARSDGAYFPDTNAVELVGRTITDQTGQASSLSFHAEEVGKFLYGNTLGMAPGITEIDIYEAVDWYGRVLLRSDTGFIGEPLIESNRIQNHSWIANREAGTPAEMAIKIVRLFDYAIDRDDVVSVVSVHNDVNAAIPDLLSHNYNGITVGKSSGSHSAGGTLFDGAGRIKPDLVAPFESTSFSVPTVSGAAALLLETIDATPDLSVAAKPAAMKALLMAGATKSEINGWSRTPTTPLDPLFGAGELHIQNSYHILTAGEQPTRANAEVGRIGWDYNTIAAGSTNHYFFSAPAGFQLADLSAMLVWNRVITDTDPGPIFEADAFLPDHDLTLYATEDFLPTQELDTSHSARDNVEHIYFKKLGTGQFALSVTSTTGGSYALAWRTSKVIQPRISQVEVLNQSHTRITAAVASGKAYQLASSDGGPPWHRLDASTASDTTLILHDRRLTGDQRWYRIDQLN